MNQQSGNLADIGAADDQRTLRIGVLGCGHISPDHLKAWAACKGADVVAICDPMVERAQKHADTFGIGEVFGDAEKMFADMDLDAVDIITPRQTHADLIRLAVRHGVHAICEKPLCPTHEEAEELVREIGPDARVMVNENWRYREYFMKIREWIQAGRLGTITQVRMALWRSNMLENADGIVPSLTRQPFLAKEDRVLISESLIHELDTMRALFGEMHVVAARLARYDTRIKGENASAILLETEAGHSIVVDGVMAAAGHPFRAPNRLEIAGSRCSVILENAELRLIGAEEETLTYDEDDIRQGCFNGSIQHFVDCLRNGQRFWTDAADQVATLKLVEDAYRLGGQPRQL